MWVYLYPSNTETPLKAAYIGIPSPTSIVLDKNSITLTTIWQTEQLMATIEPDVCDKSITWSSDDTTIATVDTSWLVTCVTPWDCTITATTVNWLTATCTVGTWRLPGIYQEVEYIESSWTQWIDTWVTPTQDTMSQIKFRNLVSTWGVIYWFNDGNDNTDYRFFNASNRIYLDIKSSRANWSSCTPNVDYEFEIWNFYVKNVWASTNLVSRSAVSSYTWSQHITLNYIQADWSCSSNRWYYVKIWDWATQVRDFVPCYRKADTVIWMYDLINGVFYTNAGSGTFTKWNDV